MGQDGAWVISAMRIVVPRLAEATGTVVEEKVSVVKVLSQRR